MKKADFWNSSRIAVMGAGSWGTVLAQIASSRCREVKIWMRDENLAREINATRVNSRYLPHLKLNPNIYAMSELDRIFEEEVQAVIVVLPSESCRLVAARMSRFLKGHEIILHATKGIEAGSMKRISEIHFSF